MTTELARELLPSYLISGGERVTSSSGGTFDHVNPATGKVQQTLPLAGAAEVDAAVAAARAAFPAWRRWAPAERRRVLFRLAEIARMEVFGPVVSVIRFDDDDEAVALANDAEYGLAAYAFTRDVTKAIWVADRLDAGSVGINGGTSPGHPNVPFGGRKQSGYGKQGAWPG